MDEGIVIPDLQGIAREQALIIREQQTELATLRSENDKLKATLAQVEWTYCRNGFCFAHEDKFCPKCGARQERGHYETCPLDTQATQKGSE